MMPWENTTTTVDPPPPPPGNPSTPTTTKLFSPEGTLMDLPTENVDKAIQQRGFKRAVPMISPEGATMYLPDEKVANAIIQKFTFADPKTQAAVSEIQRKNRMSANRVAAFPENVPPVEYQFTGEGGSEPVAGTTPMQLWAEQKRNESVNALPQAAVPALNVADKALVKPFQKLAQAGAETGSQIGKAVVSGEAFPPLPWNSAGTAADIQKRQKSFEEKHPAISGTVGALGSTVGGIVADPRMWPLALAGGVAPTLTRGAGAGFSAQMAHGAITQAEELGKILNDPNVPKEQKWEAGASAVIATLLAAKGASGSLKSTTSATPMEASDEGPPLPSLDEVRSALAQIPEPYRPAVLTQVQQKLGLKTKLVHALAGDSASRVPLEPAAGGTSHADVADYAARHNIELTPAQASQSKPLQAIQAVGERSLTNAKPLQDILDRQKGQVAKAVQDFAQRVGNEYAPDPEAVGEHLQSQANEKLAQLRAPIDQRLENLRTTAADLNDPEDVGTNLQNQARGKVAELKQKASQDYDTWRQGTNNLPFDVDLSAVADKYQRQLVEQVEALKNVPGAYASPVRELLEKVANVKSDLPTPEATPVVRNATAQAMRSAYLDIARDQTGNIPSKVQRLASQVAGDISDAMDASATKAGVGDAWKQANQTYRHLMETYQDTDSPLAKLLGQTDPTKVTAQVLQKGRFGGNAQTLQALKTEGYDLSGVKGQVLRELQEKNGDLTKLGYGDDYLRQLFTPDELGQLRDISASYNELGQHPLQKLATGDPASITARITAKGRFGGNSRNVRDLAQAGMDLSPVRQQVLNEIAQSNFKLTNGGHGLGGYQLPYLKELFVPADLQELLTLGRVVRATKFELNPSGTSNVMTALAQLASRKSPTLAGGLAGFATGGPLGALLGAAGTEVVAPSLAARFSAAPRNVARALGRNPSELLDIPNLPAFLRTKALTGNEDFPVAGGGSGAEEPSTPKVTLSPADVDKPGQSGQHDILLNGKPVGELHFENKGDGRATINWVGATGADGSLLEEGDPNSLSNQLGTSGMLQLKRAFMEAHPNLTTVDGIRIGGARGEDAVTKTVHLTPMQQAAEAEKPMDQDARAGYASELFTPGEANRLMNAKLAEFEPKTPMEQTAAAPEAKVEPPTSTEPQPTFYSPLERAIQAKLPNKFTGDQALNTLRNAGVSVDELATVEPLLKGGGTLTKAEVLEAARQNAIRVQDVWKGGDSSEDDSLNDAYIRAENVHGDEILNNLAQERYHQYFLDLTSSQREELAESDAYQDTIRDYAYDYAHEHPTGTKFSPWQVPGGENYRELLLQKPGYDTRSDSNDPYEQRAARIENNQDFHSSHWDEPNVLGHLRMNDRTDVNGKKTLFLEELQSDWHQQGRQKGYRDPDIEAKKADLEQQMREVAKQIKDSSGDADSSLLDKNRQLAEDWNNLNEQNSSSTVPDAPFKKDWHELLLKRALREAAEGGYDQLAWTPGNVQNERYDLSKQVDELNYEKMADGTYNLSGIKDGKIVIEQSEITSSKLPDYVGKEIANQILSGEHKADFVNGGGIEEGLLEGPDLKVGGAGMRTFYDQIVHNFLNKYAKRWGVKVGSTEIPTEHDASLNTPFENQDKAYAIFDRKGEVYGVSHGHETLITDRDEIKDYKQFVMGDKQPKIMVPVLPITPKMRQDILKGQPISDLRQPHHPTTGTFLPWERGASA